MEQIITMGQLDAWTSGGQATKLDFRGLPDELGGKPAAVLALIFDVQVSANSAAGGAGVGTRNWCEIFNSVFIKSGHPAERTARINNLSGGQLRILETQMLGIEPFLPATLAAAAGAATRNLRIVVPMCMLKSARPKDHACPVSMLKRVGVLNVTWAKSPSALGGNANDTITAASATVQALVCDLEEGEVPQPIVFEWIDKNGSNDVTTRVGRFPFMLLHKQGPDGAIAAQNFAVGDITAINSMFIGSNEVMRVASDRNIVDANNKDRIEEAASRRFAPADVALGVSEYFPVLWPGRSVDVQGVNDVPRGEVRFITAGTLQNFRILVVDLPDVVDSDREEVLVSMGYDRAKVKSVPAALRRPNLIAPIAGGHLSLSARKRALLSQTWLGLAKEDRGSIANR